jgi:hypothetical protein
MTRTTHSFKNYPNQHNNIICNKNLLVPQLFQTSAVGVYQTQVHTLTAYFNPVVLRVITLSTHSIDRCSLVRKL